MDTLLAFLRDPDNRALLSWVGGGVVVVVGGLWTAFTRFEKGDKPAQTPTIRVTDSSDNVFARDIKDSPITFNHNHCGEDR